MSDLQSSSIEAVTSQQPTTVMTSVNHPRLLEGEACSIRTFFRLYDQYSTTVLQRAQQLVSSNVSYEAMQPVNIKFCVDPELLESLIDLNLIEDVDSGSILTDDRLCTYLKKLEPYHTRTLRTSLHLTASSCPNLE